MKKIKINHLDLFSGIGGFHLGFEKAGFEVTSYFSEIDKYAIDNYKNNFKNSKYVGSVTDVRGTQLPKIDAITFGSPCQDFSLAGKRKGMGGDRSSLITEAIRLVDECRPRFFIWENVKGTFSSNNGEDFWAIIQAFTNIGGYRLEWQLLNTKWFLPQNRERIYLVGYLGDGSRGQVFPIREKNKKIEVSFKTQRSVGTICANYYKTPTDGTYIKINSATKKGYEEAAKGDSINYSNPNSKTRRGRVGKGVAQTLDTACNQAIIGAMRGRYNEENKTEQQIEINKKGTSNTLTAVTKDNLVINDKIRRLTPIECERLQGFPNNWTQYGESGKISDTQRYKMCGNAVTVDVVESVAKSIINTIY